MADNYGKAFERKVVQDWLKIPNATIDRLYDPGFGMKGIKNICDFIAYIFPNIYYLEIKTIQGNTFPLSNLTQYDKLITKKNIPGVIAGVIIWFREHEKVLFVPITTFEKLKNDGKKSVNIKMLATNEYEIIDIPSIKKRLYLDSDYSILRNLG